MAQGAEDNMKDTILLNNQSTFDYFCNQNLVQEITPSMQTMIGPDVGSLKVKTVHQSPASL